MSSISTIDSSSRLSSTSRVVLYSSSRFSSPSRVVWFHDINNKLQNLSSIVRAILLHICLWDCGGIDPYTLTARLGPAQIRGSGPPKDDARPGQPVRSPAQGVKTDLAIKQNLGRLE